MNSLSYKQLRADAAWSVQSFGSTALKLIAIHAGVSVGISLILTILNYGMDQILAGTNGLSDIGTITLIETIQTFLTYVQTIATPFWQMGYVFAIMQVARQNSADSVQLLGGFRHFGPVLRTTFLRWAIYISLMLLGAQIASFVFMVTPAAKELMALTEELLAGSELVDYEALMQNEAYLAAMMPAIPYMAVGALLPLIPVAYRMRMMDFALMDAPEKGAFHAFSQSMRMTRKRCFAIFKLDLRLWWYYLLELFFAALCFGDLLLPIFGITLPMDTALAAFVFYAAGLICQLGLHVWKKNQVYATYALLYDTIRQPVISTPQPAPAKVPWKC